MPVKTERRGKTGAKVAKPKVTKPKTAKPKTARPKVVETMDGRKSRRAGQSKPAAKTGTPRTTGSAAAKNPGPATAPEKAGKDKKKKKKKKGK